MQIRWKCTISKEYVHQKPKNSTWQAASESGLIRYTIRYVWKGHLSFVRRMHIAVNNYRRKAVTIGWNMLRLLVNIPLPVAHFFWSVYRRTSTSASIHHRTCVHEFIMAIVYGLGIHCRVKEVHFPHHFCTRTTERQVFVTVNWDLSCNAMRWVIMGDFLPL